MGQFERFMSQITYDMGRKRSYAKGRKIRAGSAPIRITAPTNNRQAATRRRPTVNFAVIEGTESLKKFLGILLIAVGVILVLTKCAGGTGAKENTRTEVQGQPVLTQVTKVYTEHLQDLTIGGEDLGRLLSASLKYKKDYAHTLAVWAVESYKGVPIKEIEKYVREKDTTNLLDEFGMYDSAAAVYKQFIYDVQCFPVKEKGVYTYQNGWKESRSYNGNRLHYGIDIMAKENEPGRIKVRSMSDGVIENIGWNETGGYRVGIRSKSGAYFYYAHLDRYINALKKGDYVQAGDVIGMMGDTGYGEEGTRGKFPVHLHIGIAVKTPDSVEFWVNPYSILQYLEQK
ncbi:MAG: M23 family metallopeptidase [Niameybacter sp.]|uniref:M23 family metallopeptidase n=1 Tax=Niameybacter sp. TaxID=2033640 RepID=UPI002FC7A651